MVDALSGRDLGNMGSLRAGLPCPVSARGGPRAFSPKKPSRPDGHRVAARTSLAPAASADGTERPESSGGRVAARQSGRLVVGSTILVLFVAALAVLDAERDKPGANIVNFPDALWWSITTVSTVGYGDRFPVSGAGRLIAAGLMVAGIALLGVVTASLASWLISKVREVQEDSQAATRRDVTALTAEVAPLRRDLSTLHRT